MCWGFRRSGRCDWAELIIFHQIACLDFILRYFAENDWHSTLERYTIVECREVVEKYYLFFREENGSSRRVYDIFYYRFRQLKETFMDFVERGMGKWNGKAE